MKSRKISLEEWALETGLSISTATNLYKTNNIPFKTTVSKEGIIHVHPKKPVRGIKLNLKFATNSKMNRVKSLLEAYRSAVNFYIKSLWSNKGSLDKPTLARLQNTRLSERYKSQALKQAIETVVYTKLSAKKLKVKASCPVFTGGAKLDRKFVTIEARNNTFDTWIRLSTLKKGKLINLPTKATAVLRKWLAIENSKLLPGCYLSEEYVIVWVELPFDTYKGSGDTLAVDLGENKLLVDSNHVFYGTEFHTILDKIRRRKQGSKGRKAARIERDNYINHCLKQIPWDNLRFLGNENLSGIKKGKKGKKKYKSFRKARAPWNQGWVRTRIYHKAEENRVLPIAYNPRNTSRTCPNCGKEHIRSRQGESFRCVFCSYTEDSDFVGAFNGLVRTCLILGSLESPKAKKVNISQ